MSTSYLSLLWLMVMSHFACDYCFQPDAVAREKSHKSTTPLQAAVPWYYWLASHVAVHSLGVTLVTQSVFLGFLEAVVHFGIDWSKSQGLFKIHFDQFLHVACKVVWIAVLYLMNRGL